jgi:hypothetical protein
VRAISLTTSEPTIVQLIPLCHVHSDTGDNLFHLPGLSIIVYKFSIWIHKVHDNCVVNLPSNKTLTYLHKLVAWNIMDTSIELLMKDVILQVTMQLCTMNQHFSSHVKERKEGIQL